MLSLYLLRSHIPFTVRVGGGGGGRKVNIQLLMPNSLYSGGGGGGGGGRGVCEVNIQLLMLSSNLLRSQIPFTVWGRGGRWSSNFWCWVQICWDPKFPLWWGRGGGGEHPTFDTESIFAKIPHSLYSAGGGGGGEEGEHSTSDAKFPLQWGGGGGCEVNIQLLMLSPNLLRSQIPLGGGGGVNIQLLMLSPNLLRSQITFMVGGGGEHPTFDAETKFAKIPNSLFSGGGGVNIQLLMLSPNHNTF